MDLPNSSNLMDNFTIVDESGDSEDFDSHVDTSDDLTRVQMEPEHVTDIRTEQEEFMPIQESEKPPETETLEPGIHPYSDLIRSFEYQQEQVEVFDVGTVKKLDGTTFEIITTQEALFKMIGELRNQREISLIPQNLRLQKLVVLTIGTMEKEYVIDAIGLSTSLFALKEIFIKPKIVKVVNILNNLQTVLRNIYNLYLVNVFDVRQGYLLKLRKDISFDALICQEYGCENVNLDMKTIMNGLLNPHVVINLRKQAHYLLYLYHDIKNYLLLNDEEGYMNLLEKMQKESMSLKIDKKELVLHSMKKELMQEHKCQLDVLHKLDDWRYAKFGEEYSERRLPKKRVITIAKELPQTVRSLSHLISLKPKVDLSLHSINEIIDLVKDSRRHHFLPIIHDVKKKSLAALARVQHHPHQSNNIQENIQINPQNMYKRRRRSNLTRFKPDKSRTTWIKPISNSTSNVMISSGASTSVAQHPQNN